MSPIRYIVKLLPKKILSAQARKPSGIIGRYIMTKIFISGNADLNALVMEVLELKKNDRILEVGFGPGTLMHEMAHIVIDGCVEGIDFSKTMLKKAGKVNKHHIGNGRVRLHKGECGSLPFDDESFDKVCTSNTLYFWKEPEKYLGEMHRVIKPGGKIVIGFRDGKQLGRMKVREEIFIMYSRDEVVGLLASVGFSGVKVVEREGVPFRSYCAVGWRG